MYPLDDESRFEKVLDITVRAETYADTRPGRTDRDKRERLRAEAEQHLKSVLTSAR